MLLLKVPNWEVSKFSNSELSILFSTMITGFSSVQSLSRVWLFVTPWTAASQASLSITNSHSLLKLMSVESVMPSNHLILCHPLLLLTSVFPSIRVFSNESVLHIRWPKYWSFSFSINPSNECSGLISFRIDSFDLLAVQGTKFLFAFCHLDWYHLRIWGCRYFSRQSWFQLVLHPTWHFSWCTLHIKVK